MRVIHKNKILFDHLIKFNRHLFMILILITQFSVEASSTSDEVSLSSSKNARTFFQGYSSLLEKSLAHSCLGLTDIADSLPCNPATVPLITKSDLSAEGLVSNGYQAVKSTRSLLSGDITQESVDTLFKGSSQIQIEGNSDVHFKSPHLTGRYVPLSIKGLSVVRNIANPEAQIQAIQESGFKFQSGYKWSKNFYFGLQVQFLERKYINKQFLLVELATAAGKNLLIPQKQSVTTFEPGLYYKFSNTFLKPAISLLIANGGFYQPFDKEINLPTEAQFGFAISPPIYWGEFNLTLDYKTLSVEDKELSDKIHSGFLYKFGSLNLAGGLNTHGASSGVFYSIEKINAGILYSTSRTSLEKEDIYSQTVYIQVGWQI